MKLDGAYISHLVGYLQPFSARPESLNNMLVPQTHHCRSTGNFTRVHIHTIQEQSRIRYLVTIFSRKVRETRI